MKNLILIVVTLVPFLLFAQDKNESKVKMDNEINIWMNKISSDSDMRVQMMNMMMDKTSGDKEQMMKLVKSIIGNPVMNKMILAENNAGTDKTDMSLEPKSRPMMNDSEKEKKMSLTKPVDRK